MNDLYKAAQLMLDSVEQMLNSGEWYCARERAEALRDALQKPEQEPVAWVNLEAWKSGEYCAVRRLNGPLCPSTPAPPQRPLLTDEELQKLKRECEYLRIERDHARIMHQRYLGLLTGIYNLLYPPPITLPDGKVMAFRPNDLDPHEALQELSDRIRALPDEIDFIKRKVRGEE